MAKVAYPSQCTCGHIFLEKYRFAKPNKYGEVGFCWCGFCRTKLMVKPIDGSEEGERNGEETET